MIGVWLGGTHPYSSHFGQCLQRIKNAARQRFLKIIMLHLDKLVNGVADHIIINRRINCIILRLGAITQQ